MHENSARSLECLPLADHHHPAWSANALQSADLLPPTLGQSAEIHTLANLRQLPVDQFLA